MVLSPRGGGGNLKVLIASVDMLSCIRTAFFKNLIVRNNKPYAFETWRKGSFCKNHGHEMGLRRDFFARRGDFSRFHSC